MNNSEITSDILEKNLERIIGFISNCESKVSYLLATTGIIATILTTVIPPNLKSIKLFLHSNEPNFLIPMCIFGILISTVYFLLGIHYFSKVLTADTKRTSENTNSMIFFGSVSSELNSNSYISKLESSNYSYKDDLACQIYINSKICTQKFENYGRGFKLIRRSLPVIILCWTYLF